MGRKGCKEEVEESRSESVAKILLNFFLNNLLIIQKQIESITWANAIMKKRL